MSAVFQLPSVDIVKGVVSCNDFKKSIFLHISKVKYIENIL